MAVFVRESEGLRVETKYWPRHVIDELLRNFASNSGRLRLLSIDERVFLERLGEVRPLFGYPILEERRSTLEAGAFKSEWVTWQLGASEHALEDVAGALAAHDLLNAELAMREAVVGAANALAGSRGVFGTQTKWILERLERADVPRPLVDRVKDSLRLATPCIQLDRQSVLQGTAAAQRLHSEIDFAEGDMR